jgi:hypothetical protein
MFHSKALYVNVPPPAVISVKAVCSDVNLPLIALSYLHGLTKPFVKVGSAADTATFEILLR